MSDVGQEVRRLREARGWIQAKLAVEAGMAPSAVNQIENGKRAPSARSLRKLARALEVEVSDLFPKAEARLWSDEPRRREYDFGEARDGLTRFCDHWEQRAKDGDITRREFSDLAATFEGWLPMLDTALRAERNEILKTGKRSRDPFWSDRWDEITGSEVLSMSEVWGAAERLIDLGEKLAAMEAAMHGTNIAAEKRREQFKLLRNTAWAA